MIALFIGTFFVFMLFLGLPIAYSTLGSVLIIPLFFSAAPFSFADITQWATLSAVQSTAVTGVTILFFIMAGNVMADGKLTEKIFDTFAYFLGKRRGFMPIVSILTCMFYGAISGSGPATTAAVGAMCYPILVKLGYEKKFSAAILTCAGCLGMVIPPSIPLAGAAGIATVYTGIEVDVGGLYKIAAVFGCICGLVLIGYAYLHCMRHGNGNEAEILAHNNALRTRSFGSILKESIWAILTPVIILGGIFSGLLDTMEAGAVSLIYGAFVAMFVYKSMDLKGFMGSLVQSLRSAAPLLSMLALANCFGQAMISLDITTMASDALQSAGLSVTMVIVTVLVMMLILGMFMDGGGALGILVPLFLPLIYAMGGEIYSFLVALIICQAIGLTTPPFGMSLFTMCSISDLPIADLSKKALPLIFLLIAVAMVVGLFPALSAWAL